MSNTKCVIEQYDRLSWPKPFEPKAPEVPEGRRARWVLSQVIPLELGLVMCIWQLTDSVEVHDELRQQREVTNFVWNLLSYLSDDSDLEQRAEYETFDVHEIIVRYGVLKGMGKRLVPQHLQHCVKDLEGDW